MSTRALVHVSGIGTAAFKAKLILAVWTFNVMTLYRVSPKLTTLGAFLQFTFFDLLFYKLLSAFVDFVVYVLGANVANSFKKNFASCTVLF